LKVFHHVDDMLDPLAFLRDVEIGRAATRTF
jgi:hypothetical protein